MLVYQAFYHDERLQASTVALINRYKRCFHNHDLEKNGASYSDDCSPKTQKTNLANEDGGVTLLDVKHPSCDKSDLL